MWVKINDKNTLPVPPCIGFWNDGRYTVLESQNDCEYAVHIIDGKHITHWQQLPEAPHKDSLSEIKPCPFCHDEMKLCPSIMNRISILDGVTHVTRNNNCPVGIGVYKLQMWNNRTKTISRKTREINYEINCKI